MLADVRAGLRPGGNASGKKVQQGRQQQMACFRRRGDSQGRACKTAAPWRARLRKILASVAAGMRTTPRRLSPRLDADDIHRWPRRPIAVVSRGVGEQDAITQPELVRRWRCVGIPIAIPQAGHATISITKSFLIIGFTHRGRVHDECTN